MPRPLWIIDDARPGDSVAIARIQKETWLATYPDPAVDFTMEDVEAVNLGSPERLARWEASIAEQGVCKKIWTARIGGRIVGYCVAEKTEIVHEVRAIYILPSEQGKGIGNDLMNTALEWLGPEQDVVVWVFTHNRSAIEFYRKCGFVESGKTSSLEINGKEMPDLEMIRKAPVAGH